MLSTTASGDLRGQEGIVPPEKRSPCREDVPEEGSVINRVVPQAPSGLRCRDVGFNYLNKRRVGGIVTESQQAKEITPVDEGNAAEQDAEVGASVSEIDTGDRAEDRSEQASAGKSSGGGGFLGFLALVVAAGVGVGGYIFWQEHHEAMQRVDKRLAAVEKSANSGSSMDARMSRIESSIGQIKSGVSGMIDQRLHPIEAAITDLKGAVASVSSAANAPADTSALQGQIDELKASVQQMSGMHDSMVSRSDWDSEKHAITAHLDDNSASINAINDQLKGIRAQLAKGTDLVLLQDAAHLLRVANDSLHFDRNVQAAKQALEQAGNRLKQSKVAGVADTIGLIGQDIDRLGATQMPDLSALSVDLIDLQNQLSGLQLPQPGHKAAPGVDKFESHGVVESVKGFFADMWDKIKGLVTIRHRDANDAPLRSPEQQLYLVENSRLKLETARLALMRGDDAGYHASLGAVRDWLKRYFADDASGLLSTLDRLDQANINPALPDISDSLSSLMKLLGSQGVALETRADSRMPS